MNIWFGATVINSAWRKESAAIDHREWTNSIILKTMSNTLQQIQTLSNDSVNISWLHQLYSNFSRAESDACAATPSPNGFPFLKPGAGRLLCGFPWKPWPLKFQRPDWIKMRKNYSEDNLQWEVNPRLGFTQLISLQHAARRPRINLSLRQSSRRQNQRGTSYQPQLHDLLWSVDPRYGKELLICHKNMTTSHGCLNQSPTSRWLLHLTSDQVQPQRNCLSAFTLAPPDSFYK